MSSLAHAHFIGIGGVNVSAVAKLLLRAGVRVSGTDLVASEFTTELEKRGAHITIGEPSDEHLPPEAQIVIYSSAVEEDHPERRRARERQLRQVDSFQFLAEWFDDHETVLVTGTHGKSTTTAILGMMLAAGGLDPTVVVGSRVPSFSEANIRIGGGGAFVIEGDEFARHFLAFHPSAVLINNIEWDHTDVFPDMASLLSAFRELLHQVRDGGVVVANADDRHVSTLIGEERPDLEARRITVRTFGFGAHADIQVIDYALRSGEQAFLLRDDHGTLARCSLSVPGRMNVMNVAGAATVAQHLRVPISSVTKVIGGFTGIWRRFEKVDERGGVIVISDYGHHPTAVRATLEAAKGLYPGQRLLLCFQPHHRKRVKSLFFDFVSSFDIADGVVLAEIYDVAGRDLDDDADVSSRDLRDAILRHDADRFLTRPLEYARDPEEALALLRRWRKPGDVIIVMGAGDIYKIAKDVAKDPL